MRVRAPHRRRRPADDFDLLDLGGIDRQEIPHDEPEEVLVDRAPVEQHQHRILRGCRSARGLVMFTSRADICATLTPGTSRIISTRLGDRRRRNRLLGDDGHRRRGIDQLLLAPRGGHDDDVAGRRASAGTWRAGSPGVPRKPGWPRQPEPTPRPAQREGAGGRACVRVLGSAGYTHVTLPRRFL